MIHDLVVLAAGQETKNPLIPATNELVWGTVAFLLLLLILRQAGVFRRIRETLEERRQRIEGNIEQAERTRAEAEQLLADYRSKLDEARDESRRILDEARQAAEQLRADLERRAQEDANRIVENARAEIDAERERAKRDLRREVGVLAVQVAERVVGSSLDGDRQLELVDRYIEELSRAGDGERP